MSGVNDYFVGTDILGGEDLAVAPCDDIFGDLGVRDIFDDLDPSRGEDEVLGAGSTISVQDVTPPSYVSTMSPLAPPSPILEYGPPLSGAGSPTRHTDKPTITAVQKKLKTLGFFPYTVDGRFGPQTDSAILNYTATYGPAQHGPPDDALLAKLGLAKGFAFTDDEVDVMQVQAKQANTPAEVKVVAAKIEKLVEDSPGLPPAIKQEAKQAAIAAAQATTPAQVAESKERNEVIIQKIEKTAFPMPAWKIGAIAGGALLGVGTLFGLVAFARSR